MSINKITIAYMSPTGGTERVAQAVYEAFSEHRIYPVMYDYLKPRSRSVVHQFKADELLIFICPTYFGRMPSCLNDFSGLRSRNAKAFIISTYGNRTCGDQPREIAAMLTQKGFVVAGYAQIVVRHCLDDVLGAMRPDDSDIAYIKDNIFKIYNLIKDCMLKMPYPFDTGPYSEERVNFAVPAIVGDASLCEKCSLCVKFCPCGIIDAYTFEVPESKKEQCMHCTSCIHHCPYHIRDIWPEDKEQIALFFNEVKKIHQKPKANTFHIQRI
ncbi:4Fe-4S dicluster domain-containing protein [Anaerobiospirillum thomasii]|uniref:Uncharacterized Fe-S center protein n=1 Tax=Anaerobiospirillum thomasii TaxID=179995 RepID=A0A2X0V6P2_9GAMM|nr:hypothetical protein [Anaerobiospirillum thomasii]SPT68776.1 Uncharacterized Fe-S center protein [Anaerobiospirillum thomasii]